MTNQNAYINFSDNCDYVEEDEFKAELLAWDFKRGNALEQIKLIETSAKIKVNEPEEKTYSIGVLSYTTLEEYLIVEDLESPTIVGAFEKFGKIIEEIKGEI